MTQIIRIGRLLLELIYRSHSTSGGPIAQQTAPQRQPVNPFGKRRTVNRVQSRRAAVAFREAN